MDFEEIYALMCERIEVALRDEQDIDPLNFSAVPAKPRPAGLGFTAENAWWNFLLVYQEHYLPSGAPFQNAEFTSSIASSTRSKRLDDAVYDLALFLL